MPHNTKRQIRVGEKMFKLLDGIKVKNDLKNIGDAGEILADLNLEMNEKKTLKKRIIREIEF